MAKHSKSSKLSKAQQAQPAPLAANESARPSKSLFALIATPQLAPPWSLGEVGIALVVLILGTLVLASGVATTLSGGNPNVLRPSALVIGWIVGLVVVAGYVWAVRTRTQADFEALRMVRPRTSPPLLILVGVAAGLTLDVLAALSSGSFIGAIELRGMANIPDWIVGAVLVAVVQPVAHGLVFAGVILPRLRASLSPWGGVLATSVLYALYVALAYGAGLNGGALVWYGVLLPFLWALVLCAVRIRTASVPAVIWVHVGYGLTLFLVALAVA